jgi:hypothetical protein
MTHLTRCRLCGKNDIILKEGFLAFKKAFCYMCLDCKVQSAFTDTIQGAKVLWNKFARLNMTPEEKREEKNALGKQYYNENKERISQQRKDAYDTMPEEEKKLMKRVLQIKWQVQNDKRKKASK